MKGYVTTVTNVISKLIGVIILKFTNRPNTKEQTFNCQKYDHQASQLASLSFNKPNKPNMKLTKTNDTSFTMSGLV